MASQTLYKQKPYQGRVYICSCRHDCSVRTGWSMYSSSLLQSSVSSADPQLTTSSS